VYRGAFLGETTTIISVGEREALEVLDKAKKHARVLSQLGSQWAYHEARSEDIRFRSGGRIIALPASSGGRSYSGNVVLDEFAYHGLKSDKVWDGAAAVVMHQYALRVLSTPNGVGNAFHHLWTEEQANKGYAKHQITVHQAIEEGMDIRLDDCWKMAKGDPRIFGQLFECSFLDGEEQYIPTEPILYACRDQAELCGHIQSFEGPIFAGLDVGLTNDLSALILVKQRSDQVVFVVDVKTWKRTEWETQMKHIEDSARLWNWQRLCVDANGIGAVPAQLLQKKFGLRRVEPIHFTNQSKEELVEFVIFGVALDKDVKETCISLIDFCQSSDVKNFKLRVVSNACAGTTAKNCEETIEALKTMNVEIVEASLFIGPDTEPMTAHKRLKT
jgi:phage FluMu gp28-like protein